MVRHRGRAEHPIIRGARPSAAKRPCSGPSIGSASRRLEASRPLGETWDNSSGIHSLLIPPASHHGIGSWLHSATPTASDVRCLRVGRGSRHPAARHRQNRGRHRRAAADRGFADASLSRTVSGGDGVSAAGNVGDSLHAAAPRSSAPIAEASAELMVGEVCDNPPRSSSGAANSRCWNRALRSRSSTRGVPATPITPMASAPMAAIAEPDPDR